MDLIAGYGDDGGESSGRDEESPQQPAKRLALTVSAAPEVDTTGLILYDNKATNAADVRKLLDPTARKVMHNLPYEDLHAPVCGPAHPYAKDGLAQGLKNHRNGHVEDHHMAPHHFDEQYNTFHAMGYAHTTAGAVVGDASSFEKMAGESVYNHKRKKSTAERKEEAARKAAEKEAEGEVDLSQPFSLQVRAPWSQKVQEVIELSEEQKEYMAKMEAERMEKAANDVEKKGPTSFFHGKELKDYQGRSWTTFSKDKKNESEYCYLPKRWIHSWSGHTKGVNSIKFFPGSGHLLLSCGMDGKVKIWDVYGSNKCMRTYLGHSKGVRDIQFNHDGTRFVSTGYDKNVHVWDTETGQVVRTFNTGKVYYCTTMHPDPSKRNVLMAGCHDKKIYQWDMDTGDLVQEYNYHLSAVNTVTFVEGGSRFVSTSDDKTIRVWELGIPVQVKYIADPSMHAIPFVAKHPSDKFLCGQSMDNQIVTYGASERFKHFKNKTFKGHNTAGYACQVGFSPDGRFIMSGDSSGSAFFWEWAHPGKIVRSIKAHDGVCIGVAWNPMESSKVATCGWDGLIKYWD